MSAGRQVFAWIGAQRWRLLAGIAVAVWLVLVARFWHPVYGFTRFLQYDASAEACAIPAIKAQPVFVYRDTGGYDGHYYAQIAFDPSLRDPALPVAIDNLRYRARRILGSAVAWTLALGDPRRVPYIYASLNLAAWLGLAWFLWGVLQVRDARSWLAWFGVMFSAGAIGSVRHALSDLPALLLLVLAWRALEHGRPRGAVGWLASAALARETSLGACVGLLDEKSWHPRTWVKPVLYSGLALLPLVAWIVYSYFATTIGDQGSDALSWPFSGWLYKVKQLWRIWPGDAGWWLTFTTVLAFVGMTAQALWFLLHPRLHDRVWRLGAAYVVLFAIGNFAVWEGNPGAATRVLLPLTFAFALAAVRCRISWVWLVVGMLPVFAAFESMRLVFHDAREIAAGHAGSTPYVVRTAGDFYPIERNPRGSWAWSSGRGAIEVQTWSTNPAAGATNELTLEFRTLETGQVTIRQGDTVLWRGASTTNWQRVHVAATPLPNARASFAIETDAPARTEEGTADSRRLALAIRRVQLRAN